MLKEKRKYFKVFQSCQKHRLNPFCAFNRLVTEGACRKQPVHASQVVYFTSLFVFDFWTRSFLWYGLQTLLAWLFAASNVFLHFLLDFISCLPPQLSFFSFPFAPSLVSHVVQSCAHLCCEMKEESEDRFILHDICFIIFILLHSPLSYTNQPDLHQLHATPAPSVHWYAHSNGHWYVRSHGHSCGRWHGRWWSLPRWQRCLAGGRAAWRHECSFWKVS